MFVFAATPFVALGQALARAMDLQPRLVAYGWDIAGSMVGTLLFALESLLGFAPWVWPIAVAAVFALVFERGPLRRLVFAAAGLPFLALAWSPQSSAWSPYYYVQHQTEPAGLRVFVNSSFHQLAIDFSDGDPAKRQMQEMMLARWGRPYALYRDMHGGKGPEKVLVLGAGTGNDVHVARANGAREIVAVEIDPEILRLGRTANPTRPYDEPGVRTVLDDARHFLRSTDEQFDLIVFGTLDSQALLSSSSNLRLDNYVYTQEALADARRVIHERGLVVLYYSVFKEWLFGRIFSTVRAAFGDQAMLVRDSSPFLFNTVVVATKGDNTFAGTADVIAKYGAARPATDDWPFIYLERPTIAPVYQQLMAFVALIMLGAFLLLRRLHPARGLHLDFFCLGLGFTLMESSAIARLALLFGSTWVVNAVVIASVLAVVFLANWTVQSGLAPRLTLSWAGLGAAILVNFAFPLPLLFGLPTPARALACALLIGAPVYCASVCFSRLFAGEPVTGYPLRREPDRRHGRRPARVRLDGDRHARRVARRVRCLRAGLRRALAPGACRLGDEGGALSLDAGATVIATACDRKISMTSPTLIWSSFSGCFTFTARTSPLSVRKVSDGVCLSIDTIVAVTRMISAAIAPGF